MSRDISAPITTTLLESRDCGSSVSAVSSSVSDDASSASAPVSSVPGFRPWRITELYHVQRVDGAFNPQRMI